MKKSWMIFLLTPLYSYAAYPIYESKWCESKGMKKNSQSIEIDLVHQTLNGPGMMLLEEGYSPDVDDFQEDVVQNESDFFGVDQEAVMVEPQSSIFSIAVDSTPVTPEAAGQITPERMGIDPASEAASQNASEETKLAPTPPEAAGQITPERMGIDPASEAASQNASEETKLAPTPPKAVGQIAPERVGEDLAPAASIASEQAVPQGLEPTAGPTEDKVLESGFLVEESRVHENIEIEKSLESPVPEKFTVDSITPKDEKHDSALPQVSTPDLHRDEKLTPATPKAADSREAVPQKKAVQSAKKAPIAKKKQSAQSVQKAPVAEKKEGVKSAQKAPVAKKKQAAQSVQKAPVAEKNEGVKSAQKAPVAKKKQVAQSAQKAPVAQNKQGVKSAQKTPVAKKKQVAQSAQKAPVTKKKQTVEDSSKQKSQSSQRPRVARRAQKNYPPSQEGRSVAQNSNSKVMEKNSSAKEISKKSDHDKDRNDSGHHEKNNDKSKKSKKESKKERSSSGKYSKSHHSGKRPD